MAIIMMSAINSVALVATLSLTVTACTPATLINVALANVTAANNANFVCFIMKFPQIVSYLIVINPIIHLLL
ncbi:hypothetical protein [Latilactobacillus sakei]|uniref:hypothetical protein n=1 Tax=Latilactobacillus sakei TaxID=1599 RepID=UPI0018BF9884|nr:hypothetical protein [Latilactobacillus sakei]QPG03216.1 hypothetical protein INH01_09710 [Latilactobacillus sakei]WEY50305.1 hypothetical protein P3T66_09545 [Latilactobacillus sakei]